MTKLKNLGKDNTLLNTFIAQMRDVRVQSDSMRFRKNLERAGEIMSYEISKTLSYSAKSVETPLGEAEVSTYDDQIVIATILRAGIPFLQGFVNYFDNAECSFISAYRHYSKDGSFVVNVEYISCGSLEGKTLILVDPMLATGVSVEKTYNALIEKGGKPAVTHVASVIASQEGVDYVRRHMRGENITIWLGAVDSELTVKSYIVPGMGDVGDLAYGSKI